MSGNSHCGNCRTPLQWKSVVYSGYGTYSCDLCRRSYSQTEGSYNCNCVSGGYDVCKYCYKPPAQSSSSLNVKCGQCGSQIGQIADPYRGLGYAPGFSCNGCSRNPGGSHAGYHCRRCQYDLCQSCAAAKFPRQSVSPPRKAVSPPKVQPKPSPPKQVPVKREASPQPTAQQKDLGEKVAFEAKSDAVCMDSIAVTSNSKNTLRKSIQMQKLLQEAETLKALDGDWIMAEDPDNDNYKAKHEMIKTQTLAETFKRGSSVILSMVVTLLERLPNKGDKLFCKYQMYYKEDIFEKAMGLEAMQQASEELAQELIDEKPWELGEGGDGKFLKKVKNAVGKSYKQAK